MTLPRIAFRNVLRNRRRSLITTLAIGFGFMAVAMFRGYTHNAYEQMSIGSIFIEAPGHLVVFKEGFLENGRLDPRNYLFSEEDTARSLARLRALPGVRWAAPKLAISGLITNGETSTIFLADGMDPRDEERLLALYDYKVDYRRPTLPIGKDYAAYIAPLLGHLLHLKTGDTAVLMGTTRDGQMNAVDIEIAGPCDTLTDATADKYLKLPLALVRQLYDFQGADRLCALLTNKKDVPWQRDRVQNAMKELGIRTEVRTWDELSLYYQKARGYLDVVFAFLFCIVVIIVVMGVYNTMAMSVYERTREMGTLRAIGMRQRWIVILFSLEGALLGVVGSILGMLLTIIGYIFLNVAGFTYNPPGLSEDVTIGIDLVPEVFIASFSFFVALSVTAAAIPSRRAAKRNVVDALGHV